MKKYAFLVFSSSLILVGALFTGNYPRQSPVETPRPGTVFKDTTPDGAPPSPQGGYPALPAVAPTQEELLKRRAEIFKMNTATLATSSLGNFEFSYPKKAFIAGYGWEKVGFEGDINIVIEGEQEVFIFTQPAPMTSFNPSARSLADYESSYATSATGTRQQLINGTLQDINIREQVLISTSTQVDVSGIKMLRQYYSLGYWFVDQNGEKYFDTSNESSVRDRLRYVFFDGSKFVLITGWDADEYIDLIAQSIHLKGKK